ncbi:hypothetical protein [Psychromicrobium xiongbiense]|uniref:hypothetical protein n=1 Tax=Psychromicrobium xiongbiense TaxID=3051184 RepID=UPI002554BA9F|nr:hypothetical protein [Psychromicrobium sp. YIM S02556]
MVLILLPISVPLMILRETTGESAGNPFSFFSYGFLTALIIGMVAALLQVYLTAAKFADMAVRPGSESRIRIDTEGICLDGIRGTSRIPWSTISSVDRVRSGVVIRNEAGKPAFVVVGRMIDDRAMALIADYCGAKTPSA